MSRVASAWVMLACVALGGVAAAQEGTGAPNFAPRADEIQEVYPAAARAKGLEGEATISCKGGYRRPSNCVVASETPADEGFGAAALALVRRYESNPPAWRSSTPPPPVLIRIPFALPKARVVHAAGVAYTLPLPLEGPSMEALHAAWPRAARFSGIEGQVELWCTVGVDGRLHACTVRRDRRRGQDFGAAALSVAPLFRFQPALRDGKPVAMSVSLLVAFECASHCRRFEGPALRADRPWLAAPTPDQVRAVYPPTARDKGLEGQARLDCGVDQTGGLEACKVVSESAAGEGFGAAALRLTPLFRLPAPDPKAEPSRIALAVAFGAAPPGMPAWLRGRAYRPVLDVAGAPLQAEARVACRVSQGYLGGCVMIGPAPDDPVAQHELFKRAADYEPQIWTEEGRSTIGYELELAVSLDPDRPPKILGGEETLPVVAPGVIDYRPQARTGTPPRPASFYPDRAQRMEVNGRVDLACVKIIDGRAEGCVVAKEAPLDYGFGAAALKLSALMRFTPETIDGVATDEPVMIPVNFSVPP